MFSPEEADDKEELLLVKLSLTRVIDDCISVEDGEDDIAHTTLPYLQASLFGTILEDTITQLRILVECNNELRIIKVKSDWTYLLSMKFGINQPKSMDELEGIDLHNLGCNEYKINKLDKDRKFITDVVTATYVDLSLNKGFKALEDYNKAITATDEYRVSLTEVAAKNKVILRDMNKQLRQQRNQFKSVLYDTEVKIDELTTQVEDLILTFECESRYTDNWQRARTEQHIKTIYDVEITHSESIEYYKQRSDHEQRVHSEIELLINIVINETLQKIEDCMNKFDKDMEAIDLKIHVKKFEYQDILTKRLKLEKTIEQHDVMMTEWIKFKDEREKARLYREKMTNSAIAVQAWWRGLLVRRQLGPYKAKKDAKKGKKK